MTSRDVRPVVTLAALSGAGGSVVGPRVAERLGVPFVDRQIIRQAADQAGVAESAIAEAADGAQSRANGVLSTLGRAATVSGAVATPRDDLDLQQRRYRSSIEQTIAAAGAAGAVVLGRGGMIVLQKVPGALHVLLRASGAACLEQGMRLEGVDRRTARRHQAAEDRGRRDYVRRVYGVKGDEPDLYHLILDSAALGYEACVDLIVTAATARIDAARNDQDR